MDIFYDKLIDKPVVSIIVLNYNGKHFLAELLPTLEKQTYTDIEIVVVDNASKDGSIDFLKNSFPNIKLIENPNNSGYVANNLGIKEAKGKYILLLNNDTTLNENMIEELINVAEGDDTAAMWAPKILLKDKPEHLDSIGVKIYRDGMSRQRGRLEKDNGQYDRVDEILSPSGCSALYRKKALDEVGLLDEDFFSYCEDTDLGFRIRLAGWKALSVPKARVYHYYSGSYGKFSTDKIFLVERNHLWFAIKCFPLSMLILLPFFTLYRFVVQLYGIVFKKGIVGDIAQNESKLNIMKVMIKSYLSAALGFPKMLRKRKEIKKRQSVSNKEIKSWFKQFRASAQDLVLRG